MTITRHIERAERAEKAVAVFNDMGGSNGDIAMDAMDLMSDLLHLMCVKGGLTPEQAAHQSETALRNFQYEIAEGI